MGEDQKAVSWYTHFRRQDHVPADMSPACSSKLSMSSPGRPISAGTGGGLLGDAGLITYSSKPCRVRWMFDRLNVGAGGMTQ